MKLKELMAAMLVSAALVAPASAQIGAIISIIGGGYTAGKSQQEKERMEREREAWQAQKEAESIERADRLEARRIEEKRAKEERTDSIIEGRIQPATIEDLFDLYSPENGWDVAASPMVRPDKEQYVISGLIRRHESDSLIICETLPARNRYLGNYFAVRVSKKTRKVPDIFDRMRINGRLFVVGKYTKNMDYMTVAVGKKLMPLFDADHLIVPEDEE